jgi:hypothetical protein
VKVSVAVMAHPARERFVEELSPKLPGARVVWDRGISEWDTGRRSLLAHEPHADYHVVVQDDALLCGDFLAGVEAVLAQVPRLPVSFYSGQVRPHGAQVKRALAQAKAAGRSFLAMPGPLWGVAVAIPVALIEDLVAECDRKPALSNYDMRMTAHFMAARVECWYTVPSLVNHRVGPENPSLIPGRRSNAARVAHEWIDERSPLELDWSRGAWRTTEFHADRKRVRMARVAPKTLFGIDGSGVRRRVPAGARIPAGLTLEEPLPSAEVETPEARRLRTEQAHRAERERPSYDQLTTSQLKAEADRRELEVEGTGKDGNVVKNDLVAALQAADEDE